MTKVINLSLPEELLKKVDALAKTEYATRSDFIRETLVRRIKGQRIVREATDEWGDLTGEWQEGVDLRDEHGQGLPAEKLLSVINETIDKKADVRRHDRQDNEISGTA